MSESMNRATPSSIYSLVRDLKEGLWFWNLVIIEDLSNYVRITFKGSAVSDMHILRVREIAKKHGFRLRHFAVHATADAHLFVTFTFLPRRRCEYE
jgi:hypothetical protein